jgi:hypothetical protein
MTHSAAFNDITARLEAFKKQIKDTGRTAIAGIEAVVAQLGMTSLAREIKLVHDELGSDTFKLIVVGRQKNGKSTFLNVLLTRPQAAPLGGTAQGPMPTDELPATAVLTRVGFAAQPYVKAWSFDGKPSPWTFERYHSEATLRMTEAENQEAFRQIREFEVGFPAPLCRYATLIDSPGTDESPSRTALTSEAMRTCDAAIVVYRHMPSPGEAELDWVSRHILGKQVRVFSVVNLWGGRAVDERLRTMIWDKLVRGLQSGPLYEGQDLASHDIYFVDALAAGLAKLAGDGAVYEKSGMPRFEHKLSDFLLNERFETHVTRFVHAADLHAAGALDHIGQLRSALVVDRERLQEAAKAQLPKLEAIRARRDKLPAILERYRRDCCVNVLASYEQMIGQLRIELPSLVRGKTLTSLEGFGGTIKAHFTKKAVQEEAAAIYTDIIKQHQESWCNNAIDKPGIRQVFEPTIERMMDEIVDEVAAIQTELRSLHFELTGWSPVVPRDTKADIAGRLLGIVGGILLHDVGVIAGGANGLRGLAGTLAGYVAGATLAAILGLAFPVALPVVIIAGLVGAIFVGRAGLEDRIWRATCEKADPVLAQLPGEVRSTIDRETRELFKRLEEAIMADVNAIIDKEEQALRHGLELNQLDQDAKDRSLRELDKAEAQIKDHKKQLANVIVLARQAGGQQRAGV